MNYLDVVLGLPLLWALYRGFTKGLIISAATLLALILGIWAAIYLSPVFGEYLNRWFHPDPKYLQLLSFTLTFILVVILVRLLGWGLDKLVKAVAMGFLNRFLGVFFELLKWGFILSVLISIMDSSDGTKNLIKEKVKAESVLYRPISKIAPFVFPYLKFNMLNEKTDNSEQPPEEVKEI